MPQDIPAIPAMPLSEYQTRWRNLPAMLDLASNGDAEAIAFIGHFCSRVVQWPDSCEASLIVLRDYFGKLADRAGQDHGSGVTSSEPQNACVAASD